MEEKNMTIKERARDLAFAELEEFMEGYDYPSRKEALYDYLVEYYSCAGFDEGWVAEGFSNAREEDLLRSFLSIFND